MHKAVVTSLVKFPRRKRRSITCDNGTENALHELTNKIIKTKSYFYNPYHSWEKGTVENLIGIVRRFYPKKLLVQDSFLPQQNEKKRFEVRCDILYIER